MNLTRRPRRLRRTAQIRNLVHEVDVRCDDLISVELAMRRGEAPLYIVHFSQDAALATAQSLDIHLKEVWRGCKSVIFSNDHKTPQGATTVG